MSNAPAFPAVERRDQLLVIGIIAFGTAIRIPQLGHLLYESHSFRQTQTAMVVREYGRHGVDLLTTPLPVFGPGADVPFELPLFQAVAALLTHTGLTVDMSTRLVGLMSFQLAALLLWVLVRRWHSTRAAHVALALMQVLPFALAWGAAALIEFSAVAFGLGMVLAVDTYLRRGGPVPLLSGSAAAWACALVKVTTLVPWSLLLVGATLAVVRTRQGVTRAATAAIIGPGLGLCLAVGWSRYADAVKTYNPATRWLTSGELVEWNFGTVASRLSLTANRELASHAFLEVGGPLGLGVAIALVGLLFGVGSAWHRAGLLLTVASGPAILFNLYIVHSYYWVAVFPALVALMALGLEAVAERLRYNSASPNRAVALLAALLALGAAAVSPGPQEFGQFARANAVPELAQALAARTAPDANVLVIGCTWDPSLLYAADRKGFMVVDTSQDAKPPATEMPRYALLVRCDISLNPASYLPPGWRATPTADPAFFSLERATS